jgi:putative hydrolase of the HAD superfamily
VAFIWKTKPSMPLSNTRNGDGEPPRAILFDVYQTLLSVGPPSADAGLRWCGLWTETLGSAPRLSLEHVAAATSTVIHADHAAARACGIPFPEVFWPSVVRRAVPELNRLTDPALDKFLFRHAQLLRTARLMPGVAEVVRPASAHGILLGLASNAQPYTIHELDWALSEAGLSRSLFRSDLVFWSYLHGYAKPDPHIFRAIGARLLAEGIAPWEILMVGDREDNDIEPARAQGWRTWQLTPTPVAESTNAGDWRQLADFLGC